MSNTIEDWLEAQRIKGGSHGFECIGIARMQQVWDAARKDLEQQLAEIVEQNNELASRVSEIRLVRDELRRELASHNVGLFCAKCCAEDALSAIDMELK